MSDLREYINKLRHDFSKQSLNEKDLAQNPLVQFENWIKEAVESHVPDPNAMVFSTVSKELKPSARILLLRNFGPEGFVFYTNYNSKKAIDLEANHFAALTFFWPELERQIRVEGVVTKQDEAGSDSYFAMRPDTSKLGAWSSPQSKVIKNREQLDERYREMELHFMGEKITRPPFWGGYVLVPDLFEFWQGRPSRMHDRFQYRRDNESQWVIERLAP